MSASEKKDFYVYILYREDGVTPFYVGLGHKNRWLYHEKHAKRGRSHKDNVICGMLEKGIAIPKSKVAQGLTKQEAAELEIKLIAEIGRKPHGPLTNLTRGGEGLGDLSPEAKERWREAHLKAVRSPENRAKLKAIWRPQHPETQAKTVQAMQAKAFTPETNEKRRLSLTGKPKSAEHAAKVAATKIGKKKGPRPIEVREAIIASMKGKKKSPEHVAAVAKAITGRKISEESRARMRASRLKYLERQGQLKPTAQGSANDDHHNCCAVDKLDRNLSASLF